MEKNCKIPKALRNFREALFEELYLNKNFPSLLKTCSLPLRHPIERL